MDLQINPDRLQDHFDQLSRIGKTEGGGVHRPSFSPAHLEARRWLKEKIREAGLDLSIDPAGNHFARHTCGQNRDCYILLGSHLDSVPDGGRFDGALGVVAALEVVTAIKESGISLGADLEAVDFSDEEGTFVGLLGSRAFAGILPIEELSNPRGGKEAFHQAFQSTGLNVDNLFDASRTSHPPLAYLEFHIEQGDRLEQTQRHIGVPTVIVGLRSYRISFFGRARHAGTTSMKTRQDASLGASEFTLEIRKMFMERYQECVCNVGNVAIRPGAFNIVPGEAKLSFEFRAPDSDLLEELEAETISLADQIAASHNLTVQVQPIGRHPPVEMSEDLQETILETASELELTTLLMPSFAGHDAQSISALCPSGMIFVPSTQGISHSPEEFSRWEDCLNGAMLLLQTTLRIAAQID